MRRLFPLLLSISFCLLASLPARAQGWEYLFIYCENIAGQWHVKTINGEENKAKENIYAFANARGAEGWEIIAVPVTEVVTQPASLAERRVASFRLVFKRPLKG